MAIEFSRKTAKFTGFVGVEEAEALLEWLQRTPKGVIDLAECSHLHAANVQVLLAARPAIKAWPQDPALVAWLKDSLN